MILNRRPGSIFVQVPQPESVPASKNGYHSGWVNAAESIATEAYPMPTGIENPERVTPHETVKESVTGHSVQNFVDGKPKMDASDHQNPRFLTGVLASLRCRGNTWLSSDQVFAKYYNKYNLANIYDIEAGLRILSESGKIQVKTEGDTALYCATVSAFEVFLEHKKVSKYHLAEISGIPEAVMCGYADGEKMSGADADKIAKALDIQRSDLGAFVKHPSIDDLFAESLPKLIEASRWGRYIAPGPASHVHDGTVFVYYDPCVNFWSLYRLGKGIFRDLGIRLSKEKGFWLAHIPIRVLTDKVFVASGLAAVERTLLKHTGMDPVEILEKRRVQFSDGGGPDA